MNIRTIVFLLLCTVTMMSGPALAQTASHYPAGAEGIQGPQLPPPGFYLRDYNYIYAADTYPSGPPDFNLVAYVQAPRLIWITGKKILGGFYGMDTIIPFAYQDLEAGEFSGSDFSLGDIFVEPITISWHGDNWDAAAGYGFWAPSGDFSQTDPVAPGKGYWTQMLTGGMTYYPDEGRLWSLSALNRYEFNQEQKDTGVTPGQYWTVEWGIGRSVTKTFTAGLAGYHQMATTAASDDAASAMKDHATALGPEVAFAFPGCGFFASVRYLFEASAENRPEGSTVTITLTKKF